MSDTKIKVPTHEEIELRAHEIHLKRGGQDGLALEDWLAAEKELSVSSQTEPHEFTIPDVSFLRKRATGI